jgi:hypothetical protein
LINFPAGTGVRLSATELNKSLIFEAIKFAPNLKKSVHLMEGQSWEISLVEYMANLGIPSYGVIHTPIRELDTQILNYFLEVNRSILAKKLAGVYCLGKQSALALKIYGLNQRRIIMVEAHRFIRTGVLKVHHNYNENSKNILFVSDANRVTTDLFLKEARQYKSSNSPDLNLFIQLHPSIQDIDVSDFNIFQGVGACSWGIVIFGAETSSYAQPEFAKSNICLFHGDTNSNSLDFSRLAMIPKFQYFTDIKFLIQNPFFYNNFKISQLNLNPRLTLWKKEIKSLLK